MAFVGGASKTSQSKSIKDWLRPLLTSGRRSTDKDCHGHVTPDHAHNDEQEPTEHLATDHVTHSVVQNHVDSESVSGDHDNKSHVTTSQLTPDHAHRDEPNNAILCRALNGEPDNMAADFTHHDGPGHVATDHAHKDHVISEHVTKSGSETSPLRKNHPVSDLVSEAVIQRTFKFIKIYTLKNLKLIPSLEIKFLYLKRHRHVLGAECTSVNMKKKTIKLV